MRPLRILTVVPLVAGLLFAGAATTAAQGIPGVPSVPGLGNMPYLDAGFPCFFPKIKLSPTTSSQTGDFPVTDESFVFLTSTQTPPPAPTVPGLPQMPDLSFMKCFFHYPDGTVEGAPFMAHDFRCWYSNESDSPVVNGPGLVYHEFAHSSLIVRDEFAILLCWGTGALG